MSGNNYTQNKYLTWTCKCGKTYALEVNSVKPHFCKTKIREGVFCNMPFPNNEQRKELFKAQFGIIVPP